MAGDIGYDTRIGYSDTQNGSYTDVANVVEVNPQKIEVNKVDKTHLQSADYFREKTPGMVDPGEITFKILFDKTELAALYALIRTSKWWRINFPLATGEATRTNWKSSGFLSGITNMMPMDDKMEADITICLSGKPVFTAGT